jgi:hypothetical protein
LPYPINDDRIKRTLELIEENEPITRDQITKLLDIHSQQAKRCLERLERTGKIETTLMDGKAAYKIRTIKVVQSEELRGSFAIALLTPEFLALLAKTFPELTDWKLEDWDLEEYPGRGRLMNEHLNFETLTGIPIRAALYEAGKRLHEANEIFRALGQFLIEDEEIQKLSPAKRKLYFQYRKNLRKYLPKNEMKQKVRFEAEQKISDMLDMKVQERMEDMGAYETILQDFTQHLSIVDNRQRVQLAIEKAQSNKIDDFLGSLNELWERKRDDLIEGLSPILEEFLKSLSINLESSDPHLAELTLAILEMIKKRLCDSKSDLAENWSVRRKMSYSLKHVKPELVKQRYVVPGWLTPDQCEAISEYGSRALEEKE